MLDKKNSESDFIEKAIHCSKTFSLSTGVNSFVINNKNEAADSINPCSYGFCQYMQKITGSTSQCKNLHTYAAKQAERFGGKYIYFCPLGFVFFISPLINDGELEGAIVGGPLLMIEHEEFFFEEILGKFDIAKNHLNSLNKELKAISFIPPERVSSLSEMLYITTSYINESEQLLEAHNVLLQQSEISETIHRIKEQDTNIDLYPINKERELLRKIALGDKVGASALLNDILGHIFFASGNNFEIIKARVLELLVLLSRGAMEGGADTEVIFGMNYQYLKEINNFKNIEKLTLWLSNIMIRFTERVFDFKDIKHTDVISKSVEYIKRYYMKKITLEEVAEHSLLSPSYFSKIFGEEMKCNFNNYLNQVRIENAKTLLLNDSMPLVDISVLSGYEDQSYFTKVFKKIVGVTPGKFKESRGRNTKN